MKDTYFCVFPTKKELLVKTRKNNGINKKRFRVHYSMSDKVKYQILFLPLLTGEFLFSEMALIKSACAFNTNKKLSNFLSPENRCVFIIIINKINTQSCRSLPLTSAMGSVSECKRCVDCMNEIKLKLASALNRLFERIF